MFTLAIEDTVEVPVKFTLRSKGVDKLFFFTFTAQRTSQEQLEQTPELSVKDFLLDNISAWSGQRLVLQAGTMTPAEFSRDALDCMLKQNGILGIVWTAYQKEIGAKQKN